MTANTQATMLAQAVAAHVRQTVDLSELAQDPFAVLTALGLNIALIDPAKLPSDCSIAASYDRKSQRIRVSDDLSPGRRSFSLMHEFTHHVRDEVEALVDALVAQADSELLEERVCDAFAAHVLLPPDVVAEHLGDGVTAAAVARLIGSRRASREACAVAAVQRLPSPGHVMLLDPSGIATFTATAGMGPKVRRSVQQDGGTVLRGLGTRSRGRDRIRFASGVHSPELLVDVAVGDRASVAVWVEHSPPWGGLSSGLDDRPVGSQGYCENCAKEFTSFSAACGRCGEPMCPDCRACGCAAAPSPKERECPHCHLLLAAHVFPPGSELCYECS